MDIVELKQYLDKYYNTSNKTIPKDNIKLVIDSIKNLGLVADGSCFDDSIYNCVELYIEVKSYHNFGYKRGYWEECYSVKSFYVEGEFLVCTQHINTSLVNQILLNSNSTEELILRLEEIKNISYPFNFEILLKRDEHARICILYSDLINSIHSVKIRFNIDYDTIDKRFIDSLIDLSTTLDLSPAYFDTTSSYVVTDILSSIIQDSYYDGDEEKLCLIKSAIHKFLPENEFKLLASDSIVNILYPDYTKVA